MSMKTTNKYSYLCAIALSLILSAFAATSCSDPESKSGFIGYNFGVIRTEGSFEEEIKIIMDAYSTSFESIENAVVTEDYVYMEGKYSETNASILEACGRAEKKLVEIKFSHKYIFGINVVYPSDTDSNFYTKTYGTE